MQKQKGDGASTFGRASVPASRQLVGSLDRLSPDQKPEPRNQPAMLSRFACRLHGRCFKVRCAALPLLLRQLSNPSCVQFSHINM